MKYIVAIFVMLAAPAFAAEAIVRQISVSGEAEESLVPDIMSVTVSATGRSMELDSAKKQHDAQLKSLLAVAEKFSIEGKYLSTQRSSIQPQWQWENNTQVFKGYVMQTSIQMQLKSLQNAGAFLEALVQTKPERMQGPHYSVEQTKPIIDRLRVTAIADAKQKAIAMAKEVGLTLGMPITISDSWRMPQPLMRAEAASFSALSNVAPPAGEQTISATVNIVYELKEAANAN